MFISGSKRVVGTALEKGENGVEEEKYDEQVVYVEACCSLWILLLSIDIIEVICSEMSLTSSTLPGSPTEKSLENVIKFVEFFILTIMLLMPMVLRPWSILLITKLIISLPFLRINESSVGGGDLFEYFLRAFNLIFIGVESEC